ncbi:MAG TPA: DUF4262 domain-containing protein [Candidatus Acidoferrum sp.]|nr:DUF4262 domain-containing protein [Candidatus Acidoferrum sp.]
MLDPKNRDGLKPGDARFLEVIDKYGWHVMSVAPRINSDDAQEWFSYSTGFFMRFQHPEIILCGLDADVGTRIINTIGDELKSGRKFDLDTDCADIFANDVKCSFRVVHPTQYGEYVGWAHWFYEGDSFPVWQCFWPDKIGIYPWDEACNRSVAELQPLLYKPSRNVM